MSVPEPGGYGVRAVGEVVAEYRFEGEALLHRIVPCREVAEDGAGQSLKNAGVLKVRKHSVDAVRCFCNVFEAKNCPPKSGSVRGSEQASEYGEVAAEEWTRSRPRLQRRQVGAEERRTPFRPCSDVRSGLVGKYGPFGHDGSGQSRPSCPRVQGKVQGRHVAVSHKEGGVFTNEGPVQLVEQAEGPVSPTHAEDSTNVSCANGPVECVGSGAVSSRQKASFVSWCPGKADVVIVPKLR